MPLAETRAQRLPVESFHHDEWLTLVLGNLMDGADVRVIERRGRPCLATESFDRTAIVGKACRQKLQRDLTAERQVVGQIHNPHAPAAKQRGQTIVAYGVAGNHLVRGIRYRRSF